MTRLLRVIMRRSSCAKERDLKHGSSRGVSEGKHDFKTQIAHTVTRDEQASPVRNYGVSQEGGGQARYRASMTILV